MLREVNPTRTAALTLAPLILVISGCGGGSSAKHTDPTAAFKSEGNAICRHTFSQLQSTTTGLKDPQHPTRAELTTIVDQVVGYLGDERDSLKKLHAPASLQAGVKTLLGSLQDVIDKATEKGPAFVTKGATPFAQVGADAQAIGLDDCAF